MWTARHRLATVPFPSEPIDPFFNANRPEDLATAAALLAAEEATRHRVEEVGDRSSDRSGNVPQVWTLD